MPLHSLSLTVPCTFCCPCKLQLASIHVTAIGRECSVIKINNASMKNSRQLQPNKLTFLSVLGIASPLEIQTGKCTIFRKSDIWAPRIWIFTVPA